MNDTSDAEQPANLDSTEPREIETPQYVIVSNDKPIKVVAIDMDMSFGNMVFFMIKWTFAAIPAAIFVILIAVATAAVLGVPLRNFAP